MKKFIFLLLGITGIANLGLAQDYSAEFETAINDNDTIAQKEILQKWEKATPNDADLFPAWFNYYFNKSREEVITLNEGSPLGDRDVLALSDTIGNPVGYIGNNVTYDTKYMDQALKIIEKGIQKYPNRLDMRFGEIYTLGEMDNWKEFAQKIIDAVRYSAINKNNWLWTSDEPVKQGKETFLSALQDYQLQIYNTGNDALIPYMQQIAQEILKYYPDNIENMSNMAIGYLISGEYDKALNYLLKAEKINPKDCVVLFNLAYAYREKNDSTKALEYYNKILKYGDEQQQSQAKDEISKIKKQ